jgi:hypothetical protein
VGLRGEVVRAWKLAALLAAAVLLVLPGSALAKKKHKKPKTLGPVVTATAVGPTIPAPGISPASASCPSGLQAVGGGFSASFDATNKVVVTESYRSSVNTWHVSGFVGSGSGAATAYAYCRRNNKLITDATATGTLPSGFGQNGRAQALCAPGAVALSGGFQITSGPGADSIGVPMESIGGGPVPGGVPPVGNWTVIAQNNDSPAQTITAHVYCTTGLKLPSFKQDQGSAVVPTLGSLTQTSSCPSVPKPKKKGKKKKKKPLPLLSAGAFYSPFIPGSSTVFPVHTDSRIVGTGFIDRAVNGGSGTGTLTVQSQAMCF